MRDRLAVLTIVWHKREYRAVLLIMVFLSLSTSSTLPLVTLYLVDSLHVALSLVAPRPALRGLSDGPRGGGKTSVLLFRR
jgi:hypothetical protein